MKMNTNTEQRCRLCLKEPKINEFQSIDDTMKQLFDILLLKLDLDMSSDLIICQDCLEVAKKCLNFKSTCVRREQIMLSFSACRRKSKQNIKFIYVKNINEHLATCRLCMSRLKRNDFVPVPLNTLLNETVFEVVTKYMPEMNFNLPKDSIICTTCRENLEDYSRFILNYLDTETKFKAYCKDETVPRFSFKDIVECAVNYQVHKTKQEINRTEETEGIYPEATRIIKQEEFDTKDEEINFNENSHKSPSEIILNHFNSSFTTKTYGSDMISLKIKGHNSHGSTYQQTVQGNRPAATQNFHTNDFTSSGPLLFPSPPAPCSPILRKLLLHPYYMARRATPVAPPLLGAPNGCVALAPGLQGMNTEDSSIHGDGLEVKRNKSSDMRINRAETKQREHSECKLIATNGAHMLGHKDVSKVFKQTFKCSMCTFKTEDKGYIKKHMLVHISDIEMYKCGLCVYKAKRLDYLKMHMLCHKAHAEIKIYKCSFCHFEATQKRYITKHILTHKNVRR